DTDVDARPWQPDIFEPDLIAADERLERLDGGEMAARMVADRDLLSGQILRPPDRRIRRHHHGAGRHDVGLAPHGADALRRRLIDRPVAGARDVGLDRLVAAGLLVGLESTRANFDELAGRVDLLFTIGGRPDAELVIQSLVAEVAILVRDPLLQTTVRL